MFSLCFIFQLRNTGGVYTDLPKCHSYRPFRQNFVLEVRPSDFSKVMSKYRLITCNWLKQSGSKRTPKMLLGDERARGIQNRVVPKEIPLPAHRPADLDLQKCSQNHWDNTWFGQLEPAVELNGINGGISCPVYGDSCFLTIRISAFNGMRLHIVAMSFFLAMTTE